MNNDPWEGDIPGRYKPGEIKKGKVTKLTNFGVFVELEPGLEGLLHISELADHKVESPEDVVKVGDEIEVKVLRVDAADRKIGLSRKQTRPAGGGRREETPRRHHGGRSQAARPRTTGRHRRGPRRLTCPRRPRKPRRKLPRRQRQKRSLKRRNWTAACGFARSLQSRKRYPTSHSPERLSSPSTCSPIRPRRLRPLLAQPSFHLQPNDGWPRLCKRLCCAGVPCFPRVALINALDARCPRPSPEIYASSPCLSPARP